MPAMTQLTKRPYRVQLDLSLRRPGVAFACAIDTYVTFEGEDKLVVGTSDGVVNIFSDVSQAECPGAEGDTGEQPTICVDFVSVFHVRIIGVAL